MEWEGFKGIFEFSVFIIKMGKLRVILDGYRDSDIIGNGIFN